MKMPKELYNELETCLTTLQVPNLKDEIHGYENYKQVYKDMGHSDKRFNWDWLYISKFPLKKLYDAGLNDSHINTALAKILKNTGRGKDGKK
jgi:hypothetical protein